MMTRKKTNSSRSPGALIALLLIMSLLGVFPLDVILPSFPALSHQFKVETTQIAFSVSLFALGVAAAQLLLGPLSDAIGRKRLLIVGLSLSISGALGCVFASNYFAFISFRMVQAFGCGCFVLTHALVQDLFEGNQRNAMRILQTSASGLFISLSPLAGSWLQQAFDWPGSFIVFTLLVLAVLLLCLFLLEDDTHQHESKINFFYTYRSLYRDRDFMVLSLIAAIAFTCHFSFIVVSPLLFMDKLGLSPQTFAQVFVMYGIAYVIGGLVAGRLNRRLKNLVQIRLGLYLIGLAGVMMVIWSWAGSLSLTSILLPMIVATTGTTLVRPAATSAALNLHQARAGAAASMLNTLVFAMGAATSSAIALFSEQLTIGLGIGFVMLTAAALKILPRSLHSVVDSVA